MRTIIAFAVLSIIAAMMFTFDTAEAHWRSTRTWRCPPAFIHPSTPGDLIGLFASGAIGGTHTGISIVFSLPDKEHLPIRRLPP